jgi:hypothetical protein
MPDPTGRISHIPEMHRGFSWKPAVRCATTANITISTALNNGDTIDGVTLANGDRVLVKNQSTASQNGIYIAGATPVRAADMDQDGTTSVPAEEIAGAIVYVISGTVNAGTTWRTTNAVGGTIGSTSITWTAFTPGGTVTSVALTVPAEFSVSGSPVTSSGTLAVTKANESANTVWAGPTSGGAAAPTFRALVAADLPAGSTGGVGPILISDTPSTPLIFADLIQNEAQDDLLYADT